MSSRIIIANQFFKEVAPDANERDARRRLIREYFATHPGQALFWTGGAEAEEEAQAIARREGKVTFSMTAGGRAIDSMARRLPPGQAALAYRFGSAHFAAAASGEVEVIVRKYNAASIFVRTELPVLLKNLGVRRIKFR
jgi:hypothetical protein